MTCFAVIQGFGLLLVAIFGAWIAYQQWHTAREKLRLDLFNKRMSVFIGLRKYLGEIAHKLHPTPAEFLKYAEEVEQAQFLFGDDVREFLRIQGDRGARMAINHTIINDLNHPGRMDAIDQNQADIAGLSDAYTKMYKVFGPYLSFESIRKAKKGL